MDKNVKIALFVGIGIVLGLSAFNFLTFSISGVVKNNYLYQDCVENRILVDKGMCAKTFQDCSCSYFGEKSCGSVIRENNLGRNRDVLALTCIESTVVDKPSSNLNNPSYFEGEE